MNLKKCIDAFSKLGELIYNNKEELKSGNHNPWFSDENIEFALNEVSASLNKKNLESWINRYPEIDNVRETKKIAVITAGNIPLVGFHDFLSVLITGNIFKGKLSSKDDILLPKIIDLLLKTEADFKNYIYLSEDKLSDFDAVIATGSNNSARYFNYYFKKYPHIIRKNRNSAAVLTGNETEEELSLLADDIFLYFGLGCRSVSKLFLPESYDLDHIFKHSLKHKNLINHNKYANNYDYNRAVYLLNQTEFKDNGILLMKEDISYASPISVLYFEHYYNIETVKKRLEIDKGMIQCVVTHNDLFEESIRFGESQKPKLWDYADNIDIVNFLMNL